MACASLQIFGKVPVEMESKKIISLDIFRILGGVL